MKTVQIKLDEIGAIGENRFRKDFGDISLLMKSIKEIGLLHPIVINQNNQLIAGMRRILAYKMLGFKEIPANVIDLNNVIKGEFAENTERKDFTPSESVAIWDAMEDYRGARSKTKPSESDGNQDRRERAAQITGLSTDTLSKAKKVVESGNKVLIEKMDKTGKVDPAYQEIKRQERHVDKEDQDENQEALDLVIDVDDEWKFFKKLMKKEGIGNCIETIIDVQERLECLKQYAESIHELEA